MTQRQATAGLILLALITSIFSYFFIDRTKPDWFTTFWGIVGTNLSVLGIIYTWVQIAALKTEAQIIHQTTVETRERISAINRFGDVKTAMKLIQEIQGYIRSRKYEVAVMRLQELKIILGQMKSFNSALQNPLNLEDMISDINQIINGIEKDIDSKTVKLNVPRVTATLERILDMLVQIQDETLQRN